MITEEDDSDEEYEYKHDRLPYIRLQCKHIDTIQYQYNLVDEQGLRDISEPKILQKLRKLQQPINLIQQASESDKEITNTSQISYRPRDTNRYFHHDPYVYCVQCRQHGHQSRKCQRFCQVYCSFCLSFLHRTYECKQENDVLLMNSSNLKLIYIADDNSICLKCNQVGHINCSSIMEIK